MSRKPAVYDESSIVSLSPIEGIRKRPSMYIGSTDGHGVEHIIGEPIDNAVDEFLAGRNSLLEVVHDKDGSWWIGDSGNGIPTGLNKQTGISTLIAVFTHTHTGGKIDSTAYDAVGGCFVGSTKLELVDGRVVSFKQLYQEYKKGKKNYIWSLNRKTGELQAQPIERVYLTKKTQKLVKIYLDTGQSFTCTPDHPLYTTALKKVQAKNSLNKSLFALDFSLDKDGYRIIEGKSFHEHIRLNRVVADYYGLDIKHKHVHHIDENKINNTPKNLKSLTPLEHFNEHPKKLERWLRYVQATGHQKSKLLSKNNQKNKYQKKTRQGKVIRIGCRILIENKSINRRTYEAYRFHATPAWTTVMQDFGSVNEIRKSCKSTLLTMQKQAQLGRSYALRFLERLNYTPGLSKNSMVYDQSERMKAIRVIQRTIKNLDVIKAKRKEDIFDLNDRMGLGTSRAGFKALCGYIDIEEFLSCYFAKADYTPFIYNDLSWPAIEERRFKWQREVFKHKSKSWKPATTNRLYADFIRKINAMLADNQEINRKNFHERYKNALGNSCWFSGRAAAEKLKKTKKQVLKDAAKANHRVVKVEQILLDNSVPVYDMTVPIDHNYRLNCGIFVGNTHGLGLKASNACSSRLQVWTNYKKQWQTVEFRAGVASTKEPRKVSKPTLPRGMKSTATIVNLQPDPKIFGKSKPDLHRIVDRLQMAARLNPGLLVRYCDQKGTWTEWKYKHGLIEYLREKATAAKSQIVNELTLTEKRIDLALAVLVKGTPFCEVFTNSISNPEKGKHYDVFWKTLTETLLTHSSVRKQKLQFEAQDLRSLFVVLLNARIKEPAFSTQTKHKLVDKRANQLQEPLAKAIGKWMSKASSIESVLEQAAANYAERTSKKIDSGLARELAARLKSKTPIPDKLASCFCKPHERELILVEGESAGGGCKLARDKNFQEVLTLRGKPLNAVRNEWQRIVANKEILNILTALGYDAKADDPYPKLRVQNKIILLSDADVDGHHIDLLLLGALAVLLPKLFDKGMVYTVRSPKLWTRYKDKAYYAQTKEELLKQLPKNANVTLRYLKGWGEASSEALREIAFNPKTRVLEQVTLTKAKELSKFLALMGSDTAPRRKLIGLDVDL